MITDVSKALEQLFNAKKTFLLSISDLVKHVHYHVTPKLEGQESMGKYCFGILSEIEGKCEPTDDEFAANAKKITNLIKNKF